MLVHSRHGSIVWIIKLFRGIHELNCSKGGLENLSSMCLMSRPVHFLLLNEALSSSSQALSSPSRVSSLTDGLHRGPVPVPQQQRPVAELPAWPLPAGHHQHPGSNAARRAPADQTHPALHADRALPADAHRLPPDHPGWGARMNVGITKSRQNLHS